MIPRPPRSTLVPYTTLFRSLELCGIRRDLAVHELHGDRALERGVERAVDRGHAAGPDLGVEAVATAELGSDERAHPCGLIVPVREPVGVTRSSAIDRPAGPGLPLGAALVVVLAGGRLGPGLRHQRLLLGLRRLLDPAPDRRG